MESVLYRGGKKFLWDGRPYETQDAANAARQAYETDGFETCLEEAEGKFLLYTRRVVVRTSATPEPAAS